MFDFNFDYTVIETAIKSIPNNEVAVGLIATSLLLSVFYLMRSIFVGLYEKVKNTIFTYSTYRYIFHEYESESYSYFQFWLSKKKQYMIRSFIINQSYGEDAKIHYIPTFSRFFIIYKKIPISVYHQEETYGGSKRRSYTLIVPNILVDGKGIMDDIMQEILNDKKKNKSKINVYSLAGDNGWSRMPLDIPYYDNQYPISSFGLIQEDLRRFLDSENTYNERGVKYRRGYLLEGPPGSGKTTIVGKLASIFKMPIYNIGLDQLYYLSDILHTVPKRSIILIEDIDFSGMMKRSDMPIISASIVAPRGTTQEEDVPNDDVTDTDGSVSEAPPRVSISKKDLEKKAKEIQAKEAQGSSYASAFMSAFLNSLSGITSYSGSVLIATANKMDVIEPALLRPGRIDKIFNVGYLNDLEIQSIINKYYQSSISGASFRSNLTIAQVIGVCVESENADVVVNKLNRTI